MRNRLEHPFPGIALGLGSLGLVVATEVAVVFPEAEARLVVMAVAVAVVAGTLGDVRAAAAVGVVGVLLFDGFLVNRDGELRWDGPTTLGQLGVFGAAVALGLVAYRLRRLRADAVRDRELKELVEGDVR